MRTGVSLLDSCVFTPSVPCRAVGLDGCFLHANGVPLASTRLRLAPLIRKARGQTLPLPAGGALSVKYPNVDRGTKPRSRKPKLIIFVGGRKQEAKRRELFM